MHYNIITTAAGARTRLRLPMVWKADAVAAEELPEAVFWVFIGGERVRVEKTQHSEDEYIFPALQAGQYAWDLVVDAQVVLHGVLKVRGSAVPPGGGEVCGTLLVDAPAMVLVLSPGPRGEVGPQGVQGFSAYEVAVQHGYEGSEDEWAEELSGAQAAATAAKEQATEAGKQAKAAADSATTACEKATAAGNSAEAAADSAADAGKQAGDAGNYAKAAEDSATDAGKQAGYAAQFAVSAQREADRANAEADRANAAMTEIEWKLLPAAQAAKNYAEEAKTEAQQSAKNAESSATEAGKQAKAAADSADTAGKQAEAAASSAEGAADSAAAAADTLAAAPKLNGINTFSETNTFNGMLAANGGITASGGITGLPAPTAWSSAVSLRDSQLAAFAARISERNCPCSSWELISSGGSLSNGKLTADADVCAVAKSPFSPLHAYGNYANMSALWLPLEMQPVRGSRCHILLMLQDRLIADHYELEQTENIDKPFYKYGEEELKDNQHFAIAELLIRVSNDNARSQSVDSWSYTVSADGKMTAGVRKTTYNLPAVLSTNFVGIVGFLFVRTNESTISAYAVVNTPNQKIYKIGEFFSRGSYLLFEINNNRAIYVAMQGGEDSEGNPARGSCRVPDNVVVQLSGDSTAGSTSLLYPTATQILRAAEPTLTTTYYNFDELWS